MNNVRDPDHARDGWIPTEDGAFVVSEPQGTPSWMPVNDSLKDFATWDFQVTVPKGRTVMANGVLVSKTDSGDKTTWHWRESSPMVSYLATVTNGFFELRTSSLANGLPRYDAVDPQTRFYGEKTPRPQDAWDNLAVEPEAVGFLSNLYGAYAHDSVGGIVDWAPNVFFALETQTKPNYDVLPDELTIVHELGAPVVRRHARARPLVGHVAERGLRRPGASGSGPSATAARPPSSGSTSCTRSPRTRSAARTCGSRRRTRCPGRPTCSARRCTTAAR